jgi:enoyl-CoA hydratase
MTNIAPDFSRYTAITLTHEDGVTTVTLDNPPMNAVSPRMHAELATLFSDLDRDSEIRVIILTGAGERAFSTGGDIAHMRAQIEDPASMAPDLADARRMILDLLGLSKPIIARVNGHAIGVGATLALACDLIYAAETAKFGDPHVSIGLAAGDGGALLWPQLIGYPRARELLLTGEPIVATEAAKIGLINRAVPLAELGLVCMAMARRLADGPIQAISGTKRAINLPLLRLMESLIDAHLGFEFTSNTTAEHREAVSAFEERREPRFRPIIEEKPGGTD